MSEKYNVEHGEEISAEIISKAWKQLSSDVDRVRSRVDHALLEGVDQSVPLTLETLISGTVAGRLYLETEEATRAGDFFEMAEGPDVTTEQGRVQDLIPWEGEQVPAARVPRGNDEVAAFVSKGKRPGIAARFGRAGTTQRRSEIINLVCS